MTDTERTSPQDPEDEIQPDELISLREVAEYLRDPNLDKYRRWSPDRGPHRQSDAEAHHAGEG